MRRHSPRSDDCGVISVSAGGCDWFESSAAADRKANDWLGRGDWDLAIASM